MKKLLPLMLISLLALGLTLAGCAQQPATPAGGGDAAERAVIGVVMIDLVNQFFIDMQVGGNMAAEDYGVDLIWLSADGSMETMVAHMENLIQQGVDVILVNPIESEGLVPVITQASEAGIPTVTMAGFVGVPTNFTTVFNDLDNNRHIARAVAHEIGYEGTVALLYGNTGNLVSDLRQEGFMEVMNEFPDINVIQQPMNWDPVQGLEVAQNIIAANPDLAALHCVSDAVTLAAFQAVRASGREGEIIVTSYDGNPDATLAVERGEFLLTLLTGSTKTGYWNVHVGVQLARGVSPGDEQILNMPTHFVMNQDNIDRFRAEGLFEGQSVVTPEEALYLHENFRDELFDPSLVR
jgi:ribose transport system substrate-binding protein